MGENIKVISGSTVREIVKIANDMGITKENIISIIKEREQYIIIYSM